MQIILASSSETRKMLCNRLHFPYIIKTPNVDETPLSGEQPFNLALRLSIAKAQTIGLALGQRALVIGSDQVLEIEGNFLGKPGTRDNAFSQLKACSGKVVNFYTGLCVYQTETQSKLDFVNYSQVQYRVLNDDDVEHYLEKELALDCAGSARLEGYGISLIEKIKTDDPTALLGLPLMKLCSFLRTFGMEIP